jgi:hypothetical protein
MSDYQLIVWTLYWSLAIVISLYWGWQGCISIDYDCSESKACVDDKKTTEIKDGDKTTTTYRDCGDCELYGHNECNQKKIKWSYAFSDFLSSMIGFGALYMLLEILSKKPSDFKDMGAFLIFLGIVAILGITGFGYKFVDVFKKKN